MFRPPSPDMLAYLDFSVSTTGILAGVKVGPVVAAPAASAPRIAVGRKGVGSRCVGVCPLTRSLKQQCRSFTFVFDARELQSCVSPLSSTHSDVLW